MHIHYIGIRMYMLHAPPTCVTRFPLCTCIRCICMHVHYMFIRVVEKSVGTLTWLCILR